MALKVGLLFLIEGLFANYTLLEAVAYVLSNWDNVLRAITVASSKHCYLTLESHD